MEIKAIYVDTPEYEQMKTLRWEVLLSPIGVPATYIDPVREKNDTLIGCFEEQNLIGCCILSHRAADTLQLRQMAVALSFQNQGVGAQIISFAEQWAREKGYHNLMMHARDAVIDFYKKCGYEIVSDQFFEVNIPHHIMKKQVV